MAGSAELIRQGGGLQRPPDGLAGRVVVNFPSTGSLPDWFKLQGAEGGLMRTARETRRLRQPQDGAHFIGPLWAQDQNALRDNMDTIKKITGKDPELPSGILPPAERIRLPEPKKPDKLTGPEVTVVSLIPHNSSGCLAPHYPRVAADMRDYY